MKDPRPSSNAFTPLKIAGTIIFGLTVVAMIVVSWYIVGDQTDWSTFSGAGCNEGTCGPDNFSPDELDYVIEPYHVSAQTDRLIERIATIALLSGAAMILLLALVRRIAWYVPIQLAIACGGAFLIGALFRSATMAAIGAIIFGGIDVLLMPVVAAITTVLCWIVHRFARRNRRQVTDGVTNHG